MNRREQIILAIEQHVKAEWTYKEDVYLDGIEDAADQIMALEGEELQDQLIAAYMAGCQAVHDNYQPDPDPDFTEAAWDYALSVLKTPTHEGV